MALMTINGHGVLEATIVLPLRGNWRADVVASTDGEDLAGSVTISDDGVTYDGTVERGGVEHTRWTGRIIGGAGNLTPMALPRAYRNVPAVVVLADVATELGERLSPESDPLVLTYMLPQWFRFGTGEDSLEELVVEKIGANWRVLRDGTIWVGFDTWPDFDSGAVIESRNTDRKLWTVATDTTEFLPGVTFQGERVSQVKHRITEGEGLRTELSIG
jgi:hypothetical protein